FIDPTSLNCSVIWFTLSSFFLIIRRSPTSTLFPYTTLFRSSKTSMTTPISVAVGRVTGDDPLQSILAHLSDVLWEDALIEGVQVDRKSTRLNSSHVKISYAVFCLKKKKSKQCICVVFVYSSD